MRPPAGPAGHDDREGGLTWPTALAALLACALPARGRRAGRPPPRAAASREERARNYFTDTVLYDQDGRAVRFYSDVLQGNVVVVNFIFTRCTEACPLLTRRMNAVRRDLGDRFGREVRFVSISVDPEFDTPAGAPRVRRRCRRPRTPAGPGSPARRRTWTACSASSARWWRARETTPLDSSPPTCETGTGHGSARMPRRRGRRAGARAGRRGRERGTEGATGPSASR